MKVVFKSRGFAVRMLVGLGLVMWLAGCGDDDGGTGIADDGSRAETAGAIAENALLPTFLAFVDASADLEDATATYATELDDTSRDAAREAFDDAMDVWQRAELMQVGPLGASMQVRGGADQRDEIYAYPVGNPCRVDQVLTTGAYEDRESLSDVPVNARGLAALEYLLYIDTLETACTSPLPEWEALEDEEITGRRAAYAAQAAGLVHQRAEELLAAFEGDDGVVQQMKTAGRGGTLYPTGQSALNALSDALIYLDLEAKDMKLAEPVGISAACAEEICPDAVESRYAHRSREYLLANVEGFRLVFLGGSEEDARGFDDLLRDEGAATFADQIPRDLDRVDEALRAIPESLEAAIVSDPDPVVVAYEALRRVTDEVKTQLFSTLDLELPDRAEGDND